MNVPVLKEDLIENGFVLVPNGCTADFIQRIFTISLRKADEIQAALGDREIGIGSAAGFDEIVQRSPGRWDIPISLKQFGVTDRDLPWWPLVDAALGPDAEHSFSGVVYSEPNSPAQEWHMDSPHESAEHLSPHALNVLVALHDVSLAMGPTEFARGSHTLTNHVANSLLVREELIYQHATTSPAMLVKGTDQSKLELLAEEMPTGTWVLFDDRLLHRGLANQSDNKRYMAYFSYRKNGYAENTHFEAQRSVFD